MSVSINEYLIASVEMFVQPTLSQHSHGNIVMETITEIASKAVIPWSETEKLKNLRHLLFVIREFLKYEILPERDEDILINVREYLTEILSPILKLPAPRKFYYVLMQLKGIIDVMSCEIHCSTLDYFIREIGKCLPVSAVYFEDTTKMMVYFNHIIYLAERLDKFPFHDDYLSEAGYKDAILNHIKLFHVITEDDPIEIPDTMEEFMLLWRRNAFDDQNPVTLYPRRSIYRNEPYVKDEPNSWLFAHRDQLKHMNGDEFWRKSPDYIQIDASVCFALHHYPFMQQEDIEFPAPNAPVPKPKWDLTEPPIRPEVFKSPNKTFETYFNELVTKFCKIVTTSYTMRTGEYLDQIYVLASKIRTMTEWMVHGIDQIQIDKFILLAPVPVFVPVKMDMSHSPSRTYRTLIDLLAHKVCCQESSESVITKLKMFHSIVA